MKKTMRLTVSAALLAAALLAGAASAAPSLDEAFDLLAAYQFGQDRSALTQISDAVTAATQGTAPGGVTPADFEKRFAAMLETDITLEARRFISRELSRIGTDLSVPAVAAMLKDPALVQLAATTLEEYPTEAAAQALAAALKGATPEQQALLAGSLGRQGNPAAAGALAGLLGSEDLAVVDEAASALASLDGGAGFALVEESFAKADAERRKAFYPACVKAAMSQVAAGDCAGAAKLLDLLYNAASPGSVRAAALNGMVACAPDKAPELLARAIADADPEIARTALGLARGTAGKAVTGALVALLGSAPAERIPAVLDTLAARGDAEAAPGAAKLAVSEDAAVAVAALRALALVGDASHTGLLVDLSVKAKGDVRETARESLRLLRDKKTDDALVDIAKKAGDKEPRVQAVRSLGARRAAGAMDALFALAEDKEKDVADEALKSLRGLAGPEELPRLLALLAKTGDAGLRDSVSRTVAAAAERIPQAEKRAEAVAAALKAAKKEEEQAALVTTLGRIGTPEALAVIRSAFADGKGAVRAAALDAMAGWNGTAPLDDLFFAAKSADAKERATAFGGLLRLLKSASDMPAVEVCAKYRDAAAIAADDTERLIVVSGLGGVAAPEALALLDELCANPALANEYAPAMLKIAAAVSGADPAGVRARLQDFLGKNPSPKQAETANAILKTLDGFGDYITAWEVAGPYVKDMASATTMFETESFPPETDAPGVAWRAMPMGLDPAQPWVADLDKYSELEECVAYLRTRIHADKAGQAVLELGTNDGCKVWLNGKQIHGVNVGRALTPGEDKLTLDLAAGANTLLVAVYQQGGGWGACARLTAADGTPAQGLKTGLRAD